MAVYTAHRLVPIDGGAEKRTVFVKEAFAWPAFFFTGFWAFWQRMWLVGLLLLAVQVALDAGLAALGADMLVRGVVLLGYLLAVGFFANDWRRAWLKRRGFALVGVVSGDNQEAATRRYYDHIE